jgi:hypothetical protein
MKLIEVIINGKVHRLSERAMEFLNLEKTERVDTPIQLQKMPPDLSILKIQKKEEIKVESAAPVEVKVTEVKATQAAPVEVKKKEVVTAGVTKKKSNGRKVGTKK